MLRVRFDLRQAVCAAAAIVVATNFGAERAEAQWPEPARRAPAASRFPPPLTPNPPPAVRAGFEQTDGETMVAAVRIVGNQTISTAKIRSYLTTRPDRVFDPETIQSDVRTLISKRLFADVRAYKKQTAEGVVVTFEVFERPTIRYVHFIGNSSIRDKRLLKESGLKVGNSLDYHSVEEARRKVEELYRTKGFDKARVTVVEGLQPRDRGIALRINEGVLERVFRTRFIGNTIASDARLKTQIQSKPGFLYLFKGKVDRRKIEEDIDRLTAYYRSLGFFHARVSRELEFDSSGRWLTLSFIIDEGPRYLARNVVFVGNEKFTDEELASRLELSPGDWFNLSKMDTDVRTLTELYGSQGHVYTDIKTDVRFSEQPGELELVYDIREGNQYRVGDIEVNIEGDNPHTRQSVVLNRRGDVQPGDIIDIRAVRDWERRLKASQLFVNEPHRGIVPHIKITPPEMQDSVGIVGSRRGAPAFRGQNPDPSDDGNDRGSPTRVFQPWDGDRDSRFVPPAGHGDGWIGYPPKGGRR